MSTPQKAKVQKKKKNSNPNGSLSSGSSDAGSASTSSRRESVSQNKKKKTSDRKNGELSVKTTDVRRENSLTLAVIKNNTISVEKGLDKLGA